MIKNKLQIERGFVLLLTLWVMIILGFIALQLSIDIRRDLKITRLNRDDQVALNIARSGIGLGVCDLKNDIIYDHDPEVKRVDGHSDFWRNNRTLEEPIQISDGEFWYQIVDEDSKFNINTANPYLIFHALRYLELEEEEALRIAIAITDWRDADDDVLLLTDDFARQVKEEFEMIREMDEAEAEDELPDVLKGKIPENRYYPFKSRNENIIVMEELLNIQGPNWGITPELLYGYDPEYDYLPDHPFPMNANEGVSKSIWQHDKEKIGLIHLFTVQPTKGLNINTASYDVLTAYFMAELEEPSDAAELAQRVVRFRDQSSSMSGDDEHVFIDHKNLGEIPGLTTAISKLEKTRHKISFISEYFTIYSAGYFGRSRRFLGATVHRSLNQYKLEDLIGKEDDEGSIDELGTNVVVEPEEGEDTEEDYYFDAVVYCRQWFEW